MVLERKLVRHMINELVIKGQNYRVPELLQTLYENHDISKHTYVMYKVWFGDNRGISR